MGGMIVLPQRHLAQPQYAAPVATEFQAYSPKIAILPSSGANLANGKSISLVNDVTKRNGNFNFPGSDGYVDLGSTAYPTAGELSLIVVCKLSSFVNQFPCVFGMQTSEGSQFEMFYSNFSSSYSDIAIGTVSPGGSYNASLAQFGSVTGTWHKFVYTQSSITTPALWCNGVKLTLPGSGQGVGGFTGNATLGQQGSTSTSIDFAGEIAGFALCQRKFPDALAQSLSANPWQFFQAQPKRIWVAGASSGSSGTVAVTNANDTSSASGTTTITGSVAKSNANDTSAASGTATVTGSSAITNADDTSSASGAAGSGVSGAVAYTNLPDTSSASGTTAVTGSVAKTNANDTSAASGTTTVVGASAVTNANDTSSASGVVGSVSGTADCTNNNDTCSASGTVGASVEVEDLGGDDAPVIIRKRKKKTLREQPNKHLEHILNKAAEEFQGKVRPILKLKKSKELEVKEPVLGPPSAEESNLVELHQIKTLEDSEKDAEKVAQLLAEYQRQVAEQDDEDLLMLIAKFF